MKNILLTCFYCSLFLTLSFAQWVKQGSPTTSRLVSVKFISSEVGYVAGEKNTVLKTTNGGVSWSTLSLPSPAAAFNDVCFINDTGYLFGNGPSLRRTSDGGMTWTPLSITLPDSALGIAYSGYLFDTKNVILCGHYLDSALAYRAFIARSEDAGATWNVQAHDSIARYRSITFTGPLTGYVVGQRSGFQPPPIHKTTDGGNTWFSLSHPSATGSLVSIFFVSPMVGFAGGVNSAGLLLTTDAGITWTEQTRTISGALHFSLFAISAGVLYATSDKGYIYRSNDSGRTWVSQFTFSPQIPRSLYFTDVLTGHAVGDNGIIVKTTNGGLTFVQNPVAAADDYALNQNYPNPFNSSTNIEYTLPADAHVHITVFDMLGRVRTMLVDDDKPKGTNVVQFTAAGFESGVYFYRLQTEIFSETKKLMLLQ